MEQTWLTVDELAAALKVSPKSVCRAYRKGEIPVDRFRRFVRFDLERVKEALKTKGDDVTFVVTRTYLKIEKRDSGRYRLCKVQGINSDIPKESAAWSWLTSICEAISSSRTDFEIGSRKNEGQRSATGGASRRRAQRPRPRLGKTGASIAQPSRRKK